MHELLRDKMNDSVEPDVMYLDKDSRESYFYAYEYVRSSLFQSLVYLTEIAIIYIYMIVPIYTNYIMLCQYILSTYRDYAQILAKFIQRPLHIHPTGYEMLRYINVYYNS